MDLIGGGAGQEASRLPPGLVEPPRGSRWSNHQLSAESAGHAGRADHVLYECINAKVYTV